MGSEIEIRPAVDDDLAGINDIYNHYVRSSHATFDLDPVGLHRRRVWLEERPGGRHQVLVAVDGDRVRGFVSSGPHRSRPAYDTTVETSVYVASEALGHGVGGSLYEVLFDALSREDVHRALAGIALPNAASVALHLRFGFRPAGRFSELGRKFDRYWDVEWYERGFGS